MAQYAPSKDGGIRGRDRSATTKDIRYINKFIKNYFIGGTNVMAAIQPINTSNSIKSRDCNDHPNQQGHCQISITHDSMWAESETFCHFRAQSHQFYCGLSKFMSCTHPSSQEIIAMTNRVTDCSIQSRRNHGLVITALELAQAESMAAWQVNTSVDALWREE